ncbi:MAG: proline dehydrogenase family protein, partial [Nitrospiraceae bacterium]|nr:proline dehydrogenase family protein [Nitrospiraceae bacterium]
MEDRIREIALRLHEATNAGTPSIFDKTKWTGRLMHWTMEDEALKVQLLRFVDVLPALKKDELVLKIFREYFAGLPSLPPVIGFALNRLARAKRFPYTAAAWIPAAVIRASVRSLAGLFIAGKDPNHALHNLKKLQRDGAALSIDLLGEVAVSEPEARGYQRRYLDLLEFFGANFSPGAMPGVSPKVSSFYSQMDPLNWEGSIQKAKEALLPVFKKAMELGVTVTLDMEHCHLKDLTIEIFKSVLGELQSGASAGIAIQAYLKDSRNDLGGLIDWARQSGHRITVRLVKGAYWDYEVAVNRQKGWPVPVFMEKAQTDANYEELAALIIANHKTVRPAIATHNLRSIAAAMAAAEKAGLKPGDIEFQVLYGMGEPARNALKPFPFKVRVYSPLGELIPGMAYLVRRILENTANESFLRRSFAEKLDFDQLVKPPEAALSAPATPETAATEEFRNEPATDFSKAANRQKMKDALAAAKGRFGSRYPLYIGANERAAANETSSVNPANPDEIIGRISSAIRQDAEDAVTEAQKAFPAWSRTPASRRAAILFKAASIMRQMRFELAATQVYEVGKTMIEADADVAEAIDYLEYYGREAVRFSKPARLGESYPGERNVYFYKPRGIGVVISPWNFPLAIPAGMATAAIAAGNCAILKPSGFSPVCAWQLVKILSEAGLPPGVLQYLPGPGGEVGEHLVRHPAVDFIAFTGSKEVGLRIVRLAGETRTGQRNVKKVIAEMGGKNAVIVDETADLDEAVKGVLDSAFGYQGQKCSACSRVIVLKDVFDEFTGRLRGAAESIELGPPEAPSTFMGPLIDESALKKVQKHMAIGMARCKTIIARGQVKGWYFGPAIFETGPDNPIALEEIFGPVLAAI